MISRRAFLQIGTRSVVAAGGLGLLPLGRISAFAQTSSDYRALVCVFLNGGNDGHNLIVPMASGEYNSYAAARAGLALPQASLLPIAAHSGAMYGLHPQLKGMQSLFQQHRLGVVANVGTLVRPLTRDQYRQNAVPLPRNLFSHADQQLAWHRGASAGEVTTGWGGRVADRIGASGGVTTFPTVVSVTPDSIFGTGSKSMPAVVFPGAAVGLTEDGAPGSAARLQSFQELLKLDGGSVLVQAANNRTREGVRQANVLNAALSHRGPLSTAFPQSELGQQLAQVARVIHARQELGVGRQIFFCSIGGFDTHAGQLFQHDTALAQVGQALAAFYNATLEMGVESQVTTFTASEFGRTLQPTVLGGSDHGWGSHHLVMGGAVRGGDVYGQFPALALGGPDDSGNRGVLLPTSSLDQYGATLATWFGVAAADLPLVFPNITNFAATDLGFFV